MDVTAGAQSQSPTVPQDATAPLRRFPVSMLVQRAGTTGERVSLLHLEALRPKDDLQLRVQSDTAKDWTFVAATVGSGQRIQAKSWNLWEKGWRTKPIEVGKVPDGDIVPLYFLVLNPHHEARVEPAIKNALESSSQEIVSETAVFEAKYQEQNRLLNFLSAYAALGPKQAADPTYLQDRVALIDNDLGLTYNEAAPQTQPGDLQHGLDAGMGILTAIRQSPDNPTPAAVMAQQELPAVVSDWIGLVGDLVHIFWKPPHQVKLTFVPASATDVDPSVTIPDGDRDEWLQLVTERVLDSSNGSLPVLVYRPNYIRTGDLKTPGFGFSDQDVLASDKEVAVPLAKTSTDLYLHPWAWDWEASSDGQAWTPLIGAHLVAGRGLVFPVNDGWWNGAQERRIYVRTRIGYVTEPPCQVTVAKVFPQHWSLEQQALPDLAAGDGSATIHLTRTGTDQPYYKIAASSLTDSAGKVIPADGVSYDGSLVARFNLSNAAPGLAQMRVQQDETDKADTPVTVFIAPKRPSVQMVYGQGDKMLRITGPDASWVKSVQVPPIEVKELDSSEGERRLSLSAPLPPSANSVEVTYRDPARGLEWTRSVPLSVGLPRPQVTVNLVGAVPTTIPIGFGPDPTWATADLPSGWFSTKMPVRVQMTAIKPFEWTHDVEVDLGLGSAGDVQSVASLPEGPAFALDTASKDAYVTLNLETLLPPASKRTSGVVWLRLSRASLSTSWIPVTLDQASGGMPVRSVKLPIVQTVVRDAAGTHVTLSNADDVLGVKFAGQNNTISPTLNQSAPNVLQATVDGPAGATDFDVQLRDAGDGVVHVKIVRSP